MSHVSSAIAKQARRSVTAGIHMPSAEVFALADKLVLIADGRMVYSGPQLGAVEFFSADPYGGACLPRENPADFCVSVVLVGGDRAPSIEKPAGAKGPTAQKLAEVFAATPLAAEGLVAVSTAMAQPPGSFPPFAPTHVDRVRQFYALSQRSLTQFARSSSIWRTSLFKMGWIGFLYSTTYAAQPLTEDGYINIATCFYFSLMFGILGNLRGIATLFDERSLYYHERTMRAYEPIVYFFVTTFSPMPWLIFMNCLFSTLVFWTIGLWKLENAFGVYLWYLMVTTLTNLIGFAWAQMLAAYTSSQQVAMSVWQPGVYIWSQTSDFPIQMPTINHDNPAWFLMSVSFTRWAYEAIILAVFWNGWGPVTQNTIFKKYGFTNTPLWAPLPFMFLFPLLVRLVTYFPLLEKPSKLETLEKNEYTGAVDAAIAAGGTTDSVAVAMGTDDDMQKGNGDDQGGFASAEKLTINAQGVYYSVRLVNEKGVSFIKPLLRNVTCEIKPGELCAVMGPSGAGKSTFLDWLAGRKTTGFGKASIQYNGVTPTFAQRSSCEAYVMQHDVMINTLTVNETLRIACMLRLNRPDSEAVTARVRYVLNLLSLEGSAHMLVAGLSTGQRRLASVAVEIIHLPSIVYLDEPTSGLDSGMSLDFIKAVQRLTAAGRTVVCTIHQPTEEIFGMFTKLLLIGDGMARYFGTPEAAIETLYGEGATAGGRNPAEMLMDYVKRAPPPEDGGLLEAEPAAAGAFDYDASMTRGGDESFGQMLSKFNPIEELRNEGYHFYVHLLRNVLITKNTKNQQVIATIRNIVVALWYVITTVDSTWRGSYMTRGYSSFVTHSHASL
jgi:ABC-type multidrug transport system ATPase subunit